MNDQIESVLWYLQVTDLKQYSYCPRIVFYQTCLPGIRPTTYKMEAGIQAQEKVTSLEKRRSLRAYDLIEGERHFNVSLQSARLGLTGQVDLVIDSGAGATRRVTPVDFKLSRKKPGRHFHLQLACYALLLEECWGVPVETGYLYLIPSKESIRVEITPRLRRDVVKQLAEIRRLLQAEEMPSPTTQRGSCVNCEFRRFCNDVL